MARRTPKIGRGVITRHEIANQKLRGEMEETIAVVTMDSIAATEEERALGSVEAVLAHREQEKKSILATLPRPTATPAAAPTSTSAHTLDTLIDAERVRQKANLADRLGVFANTEHGAVKSRDDAVHDSVMKVISPLVERAHSALTRMGMLKAKHLDEVQSIANVDLAAVRRRLPLRVEYSATSSSTNHDKLAFLVQHARNLAPALASTFEDLNLAISRLSFFEHSLYEESGGGAGYLDSMDGVPTPQFRQAREHARYWVEKTEGHIRGIEDGLARFDVLQARVAADLESLGPLEQVEPEPQRGLMSYLPDPPQPRSSSSYTDFDPRSSMRDAPEPPDSVVVTRAGESVRTGTRERVQPGKSHRDANVYGVTGGQS